MIDRDVVKITAGSDLEQSATKIEVKQIAKPEIE
jgi:hypothetical protein